MEPQETRPWVGIVILLFIIVPSVIIGSKMWGAWAERTRATTAENTQGSSGSGTSRAGSGSSGEATPKPVTPKTSHPLMIEEMRKKSYPGSELVFEETLAPGATYDRYLVSYRSEGLKIYAYMTVPQGQKPESGWPVVIFNHGYIPPAEYRSTERYIAYTDAFARNGYIVFRSDYRGHGDSEGEAQGGYSTPGYTVDVLNGMASVLKYPDADPERVGMWGHSMGGYITLRSMVVAKNIKAGVVWGGVVAPYVDLLYNWRRGSSYSTIPTRAYSWRQQLVERFGEPDSNREFWSAISANSYVKDISGPMQIHHGTADESVPVEFSDILNENLRAAGKTVEYYTYPGDDHDITTNFGTAMQRSVTFMDTHVKGQATP
jgi:dipeptidyl aminopeptidase/acylaminoacyl peptidase